MTISDKLITEDEFNAIIDYLEEQDFNFYTGDGEVEILNAKYFSTLFQAIYNGVFNNETNAVLDIICALTIDDLNIDKDKAAVTIYHGKENEYTVDIPRQLGIDMFNVATDDFYCRNRNGVFRVNNMIQTEKSIFKTPSKRTGGTDYKSAPTYLRRIAKKIIQKVFNGEKNISFKAIYFSGIFNRIQNAGIELKFQNLLEGEGRKLYEKECKRVGLKSPYMVLRHYFCC